MFRDTQHLTIEWGDCDPAGIVFYPRFFEMFDAATAFLLEAATGMSRAEIICHHQILGWPMVDTRAIFVQPVSFDQKVTIQSEVVRISRSSFNIEHRLMRGETLCVQAFETRVWAVRSALGMESRPLPKEIRRKLQTTDRDNGGRIG